MQGVKKDGITKKSGGGKGAWDDWGWPAWSGMMFMPPPWMMMKGGGKGWGKGSTSGKTEYAAGYEQGSLEPVKAFEPATKEEVDAFFAQHPTLDEDSKQRLMRLNPKLQRIVIDKGSMQDVKNPSSCLLTRCRMANTMKSDDWICPGCFSVRRKTAEMCNACAISKPSS